jgi:hypothetical protein
MEETKIIVDQTEEVKYIYQILRETEEDLYQSDLALLKECFRTAAIEESNEIHFTRDLWVGIVRFMQGFGGRYVSV